MVVGLGAAAMLVRDNLSVYTEQMTQMRNYLREQLIRKFQLVSGEDGGSLKAGEVTVNLNIHTQLVDKQQKDKCQHGQVSAQTRISSTRSADSCPR